MGRRHRPIPALHAKTAPWIMVDYVAKPTPMGQIETRVRQLLATRSTRHDHSRTNTNNHTNNDDARRSPRLSTEGHDPHARAPDGTDFCPQSALMLMLMMMMLMMTMVM
eukprot:12428448-Karenia_brevis.AAC.1